MISVEFRATQWVYLCFCSFALATKERKQMFHLQVKHLKTFHGLLALSFLPCSRVWWQNLSLRHKLSSSVVTLQPGGFRGYWWWWPARVNKNIPLVLPTEFRRYLENCLKQQQEKKEKKKKKAFFTVWVLSWASWENWEDRGQRVTLASPAMSKQFIKLRED